VVPRNDRELGEYYRSLDVLLALCTQQHGAHHYPVLEAMATGVPVVTTGYTPATRSNSWIVGAGHVEAAQALGEVWCQEAEARARSDRARVAIKGYAWDVVAKRFLDLLRGAPGKDPVDSEADAP
jgi:glycosyltransferase involved in cell wall biosynthesis